MPEVPPVLEPRQVPEYHGKTYRDLVEYTLRLREAAFTSEADKAAARQTLTRPQ